MSAASGERGNKNSKDTAFPHILIDRSVFCIFIHCTNISADLGLIIAWKKNYEHHTIDIGFKRHDWDPITFTRLSLQECSVIKS